MSKTLLSLLLPFCIWIGVYHPFFTGHLFLGALDNTQAFHYAAYYADNLARGVYPLWEPFRSWGMPDNFDMIFVGGLNPLYVLMAGLVFCGCNIYWAFFGVIVFYFWIGCVGFYLLARQVIGGVIWPYLAYVLLLFSTLGVNVILQLGLVLVFVPIFWFFVFLIGFVRSEKPGPRLFHTMGVTFAVMIIAGTYIPMHFLIIMLCFGLACLVAARQYIDRITKATADFIRQYPRVFLLCLLAVIVGVIPSAFWYHDLRQGQTVMQNSRSISHNVTEASLDMINAGGLAAWTSWSELFTDFNAGDNYTSYVPVLVFIFFGLSLFNRTRRRQTVLLMAGVFIFLVILVDASPVFPFLFKHFYVFQLFHNYFSICPFIIALAILFLVGELKEFVAYRPVLVRERILRVLFIMAVHALFYLYLLHLDNVPVTSFITIILSGVWFVLWQTELLPISEGVLAAGLAAIAIIQPMQVLPYSQSQGAVGAYVYHLNKPEFAYLRPIQGSGFNEQDGYYREKLFKDESGFVNIHYTGTGYSHDLFFHLPAESIKDYVQHKFVIYDHTSLIDNKNPGWDALKDHLSSIENDALVVDQNAVDTNAGYPLRAEAVVGPSSGLKVEEYDLNFIKFKTDFPARKFLVYNDSYFNGWQALMDGKPIPLYRANWAFKGMWVEAGEHTVYLRYSPVQYCLFVFLVLFFVGWLMALLALYRRTGGFLC